MKINTTTLHRKHFATPSTGRAAAVISPGSASRPGQRPRRGAGRELPLVVISRHWQPGQQAGSGGERKKKSKPAKFILESVFPSTNSTERKAIQVGNAEGKQKSCAEAIFKRKDLPAGSSAPGRAVEEVSTGVGNRYQ